MRDVIVGGPIPDVQLCLMDGEELRPVSARVLFAHGRVVVLGVPGAYTPICTRQHVPDFVRNADRMLASGYTNLFCIAPNDPFVLDVWARQLDPKRKLQFVSDGNLEFARQLGLHQQARNLFLGWRSERYLMIIERGIIMKLRVEPNILTYSCATSADVEEVEYI